MLGQEVSRMAEKELLSFRREIGFVFQEGALFDSMTVEENVAFRLREEKVPEEEIEPKVREALRFVELEHAIDQVPSELSGGMRRRVSIARALITQPPIVLYDSPTAGLDPVTSQTIITLILRLARYLRGDGAAGDASIAGRICAGQFSFRYRQQPSGAAIVKSGQAKDRRANPQRVSRCCATGKCISKVRPDELAAAKDPYLKRFLV